MNGRPIIPDDERALIQEAFDQGSKSMDLWEAQGERLTATYGGQWVILRGDQVIAHSEDPDVIRRRLREMGREAQIVMVRYVPPKGTEFAFFHW